MLEIIYRIYQVATLEERLQQIDQGGFSHISPNIELTMDCKICESREHFKQLIREEYGEDISFRNTKNLKAGDIYCVIIGEHCYNSERYFNRIEYVCDYCGCKVSGFVDKHERLSNWEIKDRLCNQIETYSKKKFCSGKCKEQYMEQERAKCLSEGMIDGSFITMDDFINRDISGYIYKISKKSTGEFYVGQTVHLPIFRWGQHLKTERFNVKDINDYQFEVIEVVPRNVNILEREKYWIQKYYRDCPEKSLNISCTASAYEKHREKLI